MIPAIRQYIRDQVARDMPFSAAPPANRCDRAAWRDRVADRIPSVAEGQAIALSARIASWLLPGMIDRMIAWWLRSSLGSERYYHVEST